MNKRKIAGLIKGLFTCTIITISVFMFGCKDSITEPNLGTNNRSNLNVADKQAMTQIAEQDSSVASFDPNFNESQNDNYLAKTNDAITPFFVWQHVILTDKNYEFNVVGDSVYVKLTKTFQGVLNIVASTQGSGTTPDTIVTKNFITVITRQLLFQRVDSTDNPLLNWKLAGISLISGGTTTDNFKINKLTLTFSNGDQVTVEDPETFFISRGSRWKWWHNFPEINSNDSVKVSVEVYSAYADTDFVTITYGANSFGLHRHKARLDLVSETPSGSGYTRVFERTFNVRNYHGYFHAVLNAFTKQTIYDDSALVETKSWGIPYKVK